MAFIDKLPFTQLSLNSIKDCPAYQGMGIGRSIPCVSMALQFGLLLLVLRGQFGSRCLLPKSLVKWQYLSIHSPRFFCIIPPSAVYIHISDSVFTASKSPATLHIQTVAAYILPSQELVFVMLSVTDQAPLYAIIRWTGDHYRATCLNSTPCSLGSLLTPHSEMRLGATCTDFTRGIQPQLAFSITLLVF